MSHIEAPCLDHSSPTDPPEDPSASALGIDPLRSFLAYGDEKSRLSSDQQADLVDALTQANHTFIHKSLLLGPQEEGSIGHEGVYFNRLLMPEQTEAAIAACTQAAYDMAATHPDVHLVFPMAGAIPLAQKVHALGMPEERISAVEINGTIGATTGEASVKGQLAQQVLDPHRFVLMVDDIGDSFVSAGQLAIERKKFRLAIAGETYDEKADKALMEKLKTASHTSPDDASTYENFARLCQEEQVLMMPVFSKNPNASRALWTLANATDDRWGDLQREAMEHYAPTELPNLWVLGAGLLDVAIPLKDIVNKLPPQFHGHPVVTDWTGKNILLRLGVPVPGLVYVNPEQIEKMTLLLAQQVAVQLEKPRKRS